MCRPGSSALAPLLLLLAGCHLDLASKHACHTSDDCDSGRVCFEGQCSDTAALCGDAGCALWSMTPTIARAGDTLTLEGSFGAAPSVHFTGADATPVTVGAHRATVVVPNTAVSGPVTVTSGGQLSSPQPFRATVLPLELSTVDGEQATIARTPFSLAGPRVNAAAVSVGSWVYVVGGDDGTGQPLGTVERARIEADGCLAMTTLPSPFLNAPRTGAAVVVADGVLYVIGGAAAGGAPITTVEQATIAADGTLGGFTKSTSTLVTARSFASAAIVGDSVYVVGGVDAQGVPLASVERARLTSTGGWGAFTTIAAPLQTARRGAISVATPQGLLVAGGVGVAGLVATVEVGTVDDRATNPGITSFLAAGTLSTPRAYASSAQLGDYLYLLGGEDGSGNALTAIERTDLTRSPLAFAAVASLGRARSRTALVRAGNSLHLLGGNQAGAQAQAEAEAEADDERVGFDAGAELGAFSAAGELSNIRENHAGIALGEAVYLIGGRTGTTATSYVGRATIADDGSLSAFTATSAPLEAARMGHTLAVVDRSLWIIGGGTADNVPVSTLESAALADDGTISVRHGQRAARRAAPLSWLCHHGRAGSMFSADARPSTWPVSSAHRSWARRARRARRAASVRSPRRRSR